jgi:hypothetical protein
MNPRTYLTNIVQGATGSKHTTASDSHPLVGSLAFSNCRGMLEFWCRWAARWVRRRRLAHAVMSMDGA